MPSFRPFSTADVGIIFGRERRFPAGFGLLNSETICNLGKRGEESEAGCEEAQGFYFARPLPLEECEALVYPEG